MHHNSIRKIIFVIGLAYLADLPLEPSVFAREALPDRAGFGYTIQFISGPTDALLPVQHRALPDKPGFGYTINFLPGDPSDSLYPVGWVKQRIITSSN